MRTVTALIEESHGRARIELDGAPWRTVPVAVVVAAGLRVGGPLDRERARDLGRALRRARAFDTAGRALAHRDRSRADLAAQLERRGIAPDATKEVVTAFERFGFVDDARLATSRVRVLAERGYGDAAIRFDLEHKGLAADEVEAAIGLLDDEEARARALVASARDRLKAVRRLSSKGFSDDVVGAVLESVQAETPGESD